MNLIFLAILLGILIHETFAKDEDPVTLSCQAHQPCTTAFASHNPITLKCEARPENAIVYWQYRDILQPHARPATFIQGGDFIPKDEDLNSEEHLNLLDMMTRSEIISGNLKLLSPKVQDTGIYSCRDEGRYLAYYEIDFQDAENIYISHANLGHKVQPNTTIDLGNVGTAEVFTRWSDWQPCDRCGMLGERKRLGFCYIKITRGSVVVVGPRPCGFLPANFSHIHFKHPLELRVEMCRMDCTDIASLENEDISLVLDNYHTYLHADALLECPSASIYKPMSWEYGNTSFTRYQQMMNNASYELDKMTGGGTLVIPILNKSDRGIYKCYIESRLVGRFNVTFPDILYAPPSQHYSKVETLAIGLLLFLFVLLLLAFFQSCTELTEREIH